MLAVAGLERSSASDKLDRGVYTDTFDPAVWTLLVTMLLSLREKDGLPGPDTFDAAAYRDVLDVRRRAFVVAGLGQAAALSLVAAAGLHLWRRRASAVGSERGDSPPLGRATTTFGVLAVGPGVVLLLLAPVYVEHVVRSIRASKVFRGHGQGGRWTTWNRSVVYLVRDVRGRHGAAGPVRRVA